MCIRDSGYFEFAPQLNLRNETVKDLITTSDCEKIKENALRFNASYVFVPGRGMKDRSYINGILEANGCKIVSSVFASDGAMILEFPNDSI